LYNDCPVYHSHRDFGRYACYLGKWSASDRQKHAIVNITADIFTAWVRQDLLSQLPKNAVIVMDNATFHKRDDTQDMIRKAGHSLLFLPPYSPDLNPIEQK